MPNCFAKINVFLGNYSAEETMIYFCRAKVKNN